MHGKQWLFMRPKFNGLCDESSHAKLTSRPCSPQDLPALGHVPVNQSSVCSYIQIQDCWVLSIWPVDLQIKQCGIICVRPRGFLFNIFPNEQCSSDHWRTVVGHFLHLLLIQNRVELRYLVDSETKQHMTRRSTGLNRRSPNNTGVSGTAARSFCISVEI